MSVQRCPICFRRVSKSKRYPQYVCGRCCEHVTAANGRPLSFSNENMFGGFVAEFADTGKRYPSHECFVRGVRCHADEAHFGGIVIQPMETPMHKFPRGVCEKLNYYVYLLIDPRDNRVFYVGKGTGNRVFAHANGAIRHRGRVEKLDLIRQIMKSGQQVRHMIVRHNLSDDTAFEVEAALIQVIGWGKWGKLINGVDGHGADRGLATTEEIAIRYNAKPVRIKDPAVLIVLRRKYQRGRSASDLYKAIRGDWAAGGRRRQRAKYAVAVQGGIVRAVYKNLKWRKSRRRSGCTIRWGFTGETAPERAHWINRSVAHEFSKGSQNPIRYINCNVT